MSVHHHIWDFWITLWGTGWGKINVYSEWTFSLVHISYFCIPSLLLWKAIFNQRKPVSRLNVLLSRWEMAAKQPDFAGEEIMLPWTFRSHASSFHRALPFQKPLRHLALHLRSSSSLPHQPPPPPRPACLIKLLFRKWCSCAPSSSARGCPGNPLSLSSGLSPLPSPTSLVRVSPLLFIFRATTCEQLPDFSPVVTLQSE